MKKIIAALAFFAIVWSLNAQVKTKSFYKAIPNERLALTGTTAKSLTVKAPVELDSLKTKSESQKYNSNDYLYKFALPVPVDINVLEKAEIKGNNEFITYLLKIKAEKAFNVSIQFNVFELSQNAILSLYTSHELTDSITSKENTVNKIWESRVYNDSILNIVLKLPQSEKNLSNLKIGVVYFGYKNIGGEYFGSPGASANCNINVNCPLGSGWENERNSVAILNREVIISPEYLS